MTHVINLTAHSGPVEGFLEKGKRGVVSEEMNGNSSRDSHVINPTVHSSPVEVSLEKGKRGAVSEEMNGNSSCDFKDKSSKGFPGMQSISCFL